MKDIFFVTITLFAVLILAFATVSASENNSETITIPASKDNTLYEDDSGALSNGAGAYFFAGKAADQEIRRGVIAFELAGSVPTNAIIVGAELKLHMSKSIAGLQPVAAHRLLLDWGEGASNATGQEGGGAPAQTGDTTWLHTFCCDQFWTEAGRPSGGVFAITPSASTMVGDVGEYVWEDSELINDIKYWLDNPDKNYGWILIGNEEVGTTTKRFDSLQNPSAQVRPQLVIEYLIPSSQIFLPMIMGG